MTDSEIPSPVELTADPGYKAGETPQNLVWPKKLWVVLPPNPSDMHLKVHRTIVHAANEKSIHVSPMRVREERGEGGLKFKTLAPDDAAALYRSAHRFRTGVFALSGAKVQLDVSEKVTNQGSISLEEFVRYKCAYRFVSRPEELTSSISHIFAWLDGEDCEGSKDPRCLPLTMFQTRDGSIDLSDVSERDRFMQMHHSSEMKALVDGRGRAWQVGPYHTKDLLQVAGQCLPMGFHWDVQVVRGGNFANGWERWEVRKGGYTNIHPDATIRGGQATLTHSALKNQDEPVAAQPKTPRRKRRAHGRKK